jgi:hypothetical protein
MKTPIIKIWKGFIPIIVVIFLFSCEKSDDLNNNDVTGTYTGTLTSSLTSRSNNSELIKPATVVVSNFGNQIQVHCSAENFDTTVILDIYDYNDNVMVCLTGEEFENMYGHMLGQGNTNGHMQNNGADWMQHLNNEHQETDEHFGGFDMQNHTFNYTFKMNNEEFYFEGLKE